METINQEIIELYKEGNRISDIEKKFGYKIDREDIEYVISEYKSDIYLEKEINDVLYKNIINLYLNRNTVLDIMNMYPELNFGQIKKVINEYYTIFSMKKPYPIDFPNSLIRAELKKKSLEQVSEEYGYSITKIKKHLNIDLTVEELFDKKMKELERDTKVLSDKNFKNKYNSINVNGKNVMLSKNIAKKLVKEYKNKQSK